MKGSLSLLLFLSLWSRSASAQHETDHWLFGHKAGLSFKGEAITALPGSKLHQSEGSAVISERETGRLLFYTNGLHIWNRQHELMANGSGLRGSSTSTQSALIVPAPGAQGRYYVFTVKAYNDGPHSGLHYSVVDMTLNNGLGAVRGDIRNRLLDTRTTEKLTAILHANGQDYWVLAHGWNSDDFLITCITSAGVSAIRRQRIGSVHRAGTRVKNSEAMGYLKASPDGTKVASAVYGTDRPFELYDFDARTGELSNYRSLGDFSHQYGVSFSPDNSKLYLSGLYAHDGSYQFDLSAPDYPVTPLTQTDTLGGKPLQSYLSGALQLGIDGRLYAAGSSAGRGGPGNIQMAVVEQPNAAGSQCRISYRSIGNNMPLLGLPNFIQSVFNQPVGKEEIALDGVKLYPNPVLLNTLTIEPLTADLPIESFVVYDNGGRIILRHDQPVRAKLVLDTSRWGSTGIYEVVFKNRMQSVTKKIIKP